LDERIDERKVCAKDGRVRLSQIPNGPLCAKRVGK
jgi:hypothetical protein